MKTAEEIKQILIDGQEAAEKTITALLAKAKSLRGDQYDATNHLDLRETNQLNSAFSIQIVYSHLLKTIMDDSKDPLHELTKKVEEKHDERDR